MENVIEHEVLLCIELIMTLQPVINTLTIQMKARHMKQIKGPVLQTDHCLYIPSVQLIARLPAFIVTIKWHFATRSADPTVFPAGCRLFKNVLISFENSICGHPPRCWSLFYDVQTPSLASFLTQTSCDVKMKSQKPRAGPLAALNGRPVYWRTRS